MEATHKIDIVRYAIVKEHTLEYNTPIANHYAAAELFRKFIGDRDREVFAVIGLDIKNKPTFLNIVSIGQLNQTAVEMRELFKPAILSNSSAIIVAHNHPSGTTDASPEDVRITEKIKNAGKMLGIKLLDHIIVTTDDAVSIKDTNAKLS